MQANEKKKTKEIFLKRKNQKKEKKKKEKRKGNKWNEKSEEISKSIVTNVKNFIGREVGVRIDKFQRYERWTLEKQLRYMRQLMTRYYFSFLKTRRILYAQYAGIQVLHWLAIMMSIYSTVKKL